MGRSDKDSQREYDSEGSYERSRRKKSKRRSKSEGRQRKDSSRSTQQLDDDHGLDDDHDKGRQSTDRKRHQRDRKRDEDKKERRNRRELSASDEGSVSSSVLSGSNGGWRKGDRKTNDKRRKRSSHRKEKKSKKEKRRREVESSKLGKKRKKSRSEDGVGGEDATAVFKEFQRNFELAEALHELLSYHPTVMATDTLPLILIQLGGGTTLDLRQMADQHAAQGLQRVLTSLHHFGVVQEENVWRWKAPGSGPNAYRDERILLRVVRTLLNDIGLTVDAIDRHEKKENEKRETAANSPIEYKKEEKEERGNMTGDMDMKKEVLEMLQAFQKEKDQGDSTLPGELGGLAKMILEGESISLDGLPDPRLKEALQGLFMKCGLEKFEMEESESDNKDDDDDDGKATTSSIGYGLPESLDQQNDAKGKLLRVMDACKYAALNSASPRKKAVKGPMPMPATFVPPDESSDEEGPTPVGVARKRSPHLSKELVEAQAETRARQLKGAATGQPELMETGPNQREEWMLVPGKFDFLSSVKAGNPQRSRTFQSKSKVDDGTSNEKVVDPNVKAEMDAIMQAHTEARGPTLVEQHRMKKEQERQEKAASGKSKKGDWTWNREKDLDAGRKVDKNALHQVLGGAVSDLKKKFQGGF